MVFGLVHGGGKLMPSMVFITEVMELSFVVPWFITAAIHNFNNYYVTAVKDASGCDDNARVILYARPFAFLNCCLLFLTLILTLIVDEARHDLPPHVVPSVSDMWVYKPSNWISRWAVVQAVPLAFMAHLFSHIGMNSLAFLAAHATVRLQALCPKCINIK